MPVIYYVNIEPAEKENSFQVIWQNRENNWQNCFIGKSEITTEDIQWLWQIPSYQLEIGQKLFRFLDGDAHHFKQALNQANLQGEILQVYLRSCKQTSDWPFELLAADGVFLLPKQVHLVRYVSEWGIGKVIPPENRPLKLLFMACSAMDVESKLGFEREEEAIFNITEKLSIDMEVEDSGSLEGLRNKLVQEQYDVVHLSGHADINKNGRPFFIMEDEMGYIQQVFPDQLWNEALIEKPPRLLFLSGCRTGEAPNREESIGVVSFAQLLVEECKVPAVLGWGRSVLDNQASHAGKMLFHELSCGKTILEAVWRARYELIKNFPKSDKPAWPLLRLFSSGIPLNAIVEKEQKWKPKDRRMTHVYLKNSEVKVLAKGFVGRRRQIQTSLRALKQDYDKVGLLLLGTGGLGKSCLAGKICERFRDHTLIIVHGRFNTITLVSALKDAFIVSQDENGQEILSRDIEVTEKLAHLCATSFKEKNYLFLLDDFEQNLEGVDKGQPGPLLPEAADLLKVLLHYLPFSGKMTQLIITSRYDFSLITDNIELVNQRLEKVWLTSFHEAELQKKAQGLKNISNYPDRLLLPRLLAAGNGNPRLMEWVDLLVGQMAASEVPKLLEAIKDKQEDFIREHVIRELLQRGGEELMHFLHWFSIYRRPVPQEGIRHVAEKAGLEGWNELLLEGMRLSLVEHDQVRSSYQVTPLLREELLKGIEEPETYHEAAFLYYKAVCEAREKIDPILTEEWIYHALGCGEEDVASAQGVALITYLRESSALKESRRVGEWILSEKESECSTANDALMLNALGNTIIHLADYHQAISYFEQALFIYRLYGKENVGVALVLNNLGGAWSHLGEYEKSLNYSQLALTIYEKNYGEKSHHVATTVNNIGDDWRLLGEPQKAVEYFQRALEIVEAQFGKKHSDVAYKLNNLGAAFMDLSDYRKALDYYEQALAIWKEIYGENNSIVAVAYNNVGSASRALGDHYKATYFFHKTLSICKEIYGEKHPYLATVLNNLALIFKDKGDHRKAIEYFEQALDIDEAFFGRENTKVAHQLNNIGSVYNDLHDYKTAMDYYKKALDVYKNIHGNNNPEVAGVLNRMGLAYVALGEFKRAIDYYQRALSIRKNIYGEKNTDVANVFYNLGEAWLLLEDYPHAIKYFEKLLTIDREIYGEKHEYVMLALSMLGKGWAALGEYKKALDYYQQEIAMIYEFNDVVNPVVAIELAKLGMDCAKEENHLRAIAFYQQSLNIFKKKYSENQSYLVGVLSLLGSTWYDLKDYKKAIDYFQQALSIDLIVYKEDHPEIAKIFKILGYIWFDLEEYNKAINYFQKALNILMKIYDVENENHSDVGNICKSLGMTWYILGDYNKTIKYYQKALNIWKKIYGETHPDVAVALKFLGLAWKSLGNHQKAINYFEQALTIYRAIYGEEHSDVESVLNNLGLVFDALGEFKKAIDYYQQALNISKSIYGEKHPYVAHIYYNLGLAWDSSKDYRQAIKYFEQALSIYREVYGEYHQEVGNDLIGLGAAYFNWGQKKRAKSHFKKAYKIYSKIYGPEHPETKDVSEWLNKCK